MGSKAIPEIDVLWITAGLACDGDTTAMTAAKQPGIRDIITGALPRTPKVNLLNPFLAMENGDEFMVKFHQAAEGRLGRRPEIEASVGYSREEWLEEPVRWYERLHPDDKTRWSIKAAEMFLSGKPVRSAYRVPARDGSTVCFQCDTRMMRREDGQPWFIHGVAFDISGLKHTEKQLQGETQSGLCDSRDRGCPCSGYGQKKMRDSGRQA